MNAQKNNSFVTFANFNLFKVALICSHILMCFFLFAEIAFGACAPPPIPDELETDTAELIYAKAGWAAFKDRDPMQCWAVASPIESEIEEDDESDNLCRGFTSMSVNFVPGKSVSGEFFVISGYEFEANAPVQLLIDGQIIIDQMLVDEQFAWVNNVQEDKLVRHAMLLGKFIEIKGKAVSGQAIRDVYLLKGFEASVRAAQSACSEIKDDFEMYQASWSGSN